MCVITDQVWFANGMPCFQEQSIQFALVEKSVCILQVTVFMSRTFNRRQGLIAGSVVAAVHLLFLLYLHFAYHSVYEGQ